MDHVYIGLGSNVGDRLQYLEFALSFIERSPDTIIKNISSVYETEPVGKRDQAYFFNIVAELETNLPAIKLLKKFKVIEQQLGRTPTERWGAREIDIDLLYVGEQVIREKNLIVPHPEIHSRKFVLVPLSQIAGEFKDPVSNLSIHDLLLQCTDKSEVKKTSYSIQPHAVEP
ncbi:MAG: 2-amino-4-hydroxy-6-hydroxymethyldihydropteridine diphosphokinase [Ignavibacteriales bacterium]|nr:2-amino-4-hydroxy-6-hydroxymethyldihydropteridine diphosphokinase [Ignavibacteriales bacterium]